MKNKSNKTTNVIFICSGNIFRSPSAEYLMRKYLQDNNIENINVSSAGTSAVPQYPYDETVERQLYYGVDTKNHKQRKVTSEILKDQDFIICMTKHHKDRVEELGYKGILLKEITEGKYEDLKDDDEYGHENGWDYDLKKLI